MRISKGTAKQLTHVASVAAVAVLCAGLACAPVAAAKSEMYRFEIAGGDLAEQLNRFAVTTSIQVLYNPKVLVHLKGKGINGRFSKEEGARRLLQDSGLSWRFIDNNVLMVEAGLPVVSKKLPTPVASDEPAVSVTVVGARPAEQTALDLKRRAPSLVESITSQDMEKYPDANIGDAMQRLTSVTMSRSHGEGYQVTVRGFGPQFNNVLMDDNLMPSRNAGREFNFNDFSTDLINSVVVYKTAPPSIPSGGLGSTIDIRPADPFDYKDDYATVSIGTTFPTPVIAATFSKRLHGGKIGILASISRQAFDEEERSIGIAAWKRDTAYMDGVVDDSANTTGHIYSPQNFGLGITQFERTRLNGRLVVQYRASDAFEYKAYIQYADLVDSWKYAGINSWFTTFDPSTKNVKTDANGTVVDYFQQNGLDFMASHNQGRTVDESIGGTIKWRPRPDLSVEMDVNSVTSRQNPGGEVEQKDTYVGYRNQAQFLLGGGAHALPSIQGYTNQDVLNAALNGGQATDYVDPALLRAHVIASSAERTSDTISEARLKASRYRDLGRISVGISYLHRAKVVRYVDNTDVACFYCGYPETPDLPDSLFATRIKVPANFIPGYHVSSALPTFLVDYDPDALVAFLTQQSGISFSPVEQPSGFRVQEHTLAAYWETEFESALAGRPLHGLIGARYETTAIEAAGHDRTLEALEFLDITMEKPIYGAVTPVASKTKYSFLLPSADLRWSVTDRMDVRLGLSRTLARPPIEYLAPALRITVTRPGNFGAFLGNPELKPYVSTNLDLALEWPHGPNAFGGITLFAKSVDNFIVQTAFTQTINGVTDPATGTDFSAPDAADGLAQFMISEPVNGERALVWGQEFSWQRFFPTTGLGFIANLTLVNSNKRFDPQDVGKTFAITGLSDSASIVGYLDRGPLNLRMTWSWRDEYLAQIGQTLDLTEPTFVNARAQLDLSWTVHLRSNLSLYGYATNLTRSSAGTHGRYANQFLSAVSTDSRLLMGLRLRL